MSTFDQRQEGFERKFAHDENLRFKTTARRNRLLGLWAAEQIGLSGEEAAAYARSVVESDFDRPGDEDVLEKVSADLKAKNLSVTDAAIRQAMDRLMVEAKQQIMTETPS